MKNLNGLLASILLLVSLQAGAGQGEDSAPLVPPSQGVDRLDLLSVSPCKASGDGTFTEMITTMASVLPPALGDAFLQRYCDECVKRKLALSK